MNKLLFSSLGIAVSVFLGGAVLLSPAFVFAEEANPEVTALQAQISSLLAQIASLKAQIAEIKIGIKPVPPVADVEPPTIFPPPVSVPLCPRFTENLFIGKKDSNANGQVSQLQKFLAQDKSIYPEGSISGFFGPLTRDAVKRWQLKHGVVSPGSSESAGHGMVGPQTRSALTIACRPVRPVHENNELTIEPSSAELKVGESVELHAFYQPPMPPCPEEFACAQMMPARQEVVASFSSSNPAVAAVEEVALECTTAVERPCEQNHVFVRGVGAGDALITASYAGTSADRAASVATMKVTVGDAHSDKNLPPTIRGVSGPVSLRVGARGSWEVKASDPENQSLSYSVVWGDERVFASSAMPGTQSEKAIEQTSSFTHTYNDGGLYRPVFTVRDSAGNEEHTSITVHVGTAPSTQGSIEVVVSDYDSASVIYCIQAPCPQPPRNTLDYAKVSLYNNFGQFVRSVETKDGTAVFDELHPGVYVVRASAPGYTEGKESVAVAAGSVSFLEIALRRAVTPPPVPVGGSLSISPPHATIAIGASHPVKAMFTPARPACLDAIPACKIPERAPYEVRALFVSDNPKIASIETAIASCASPLPGTPAACPLPTSFVRGVSPGSTIITASYTESGRTYRAKMEVLVGGGTSQSLTLLSPNGGETWIKGSPQTITWKDNTSLPECSAGAFCKLVLRSYDITLAPYYPPCTSSICPAFPYFAPYTIATSVSGSSYSWSVGKILNTLNTDMAPDGSYTIQICPTGVSTCDSSDSYFKITSVGTSTNNPPNIIGVTTTQCERAGDGSCLPLDVQPGKTVSFVYTATDADNDNLSWSFDWGDGPSEGTACAVAVTVAGGVVAKTAATPCGWNVTIGHAWQKAGIYTVKAVANDGKGGTDTHSFSITVGANASTSVTVLSPNGGEWWLRGSSQVITWKSSAPTVMVDLIRPGFEYHLTGPTGDITNTGSLNITVPGTVPDANDYKIRVMYRINAAVVSEDTSDKPFSIIGSTGNAQAGKVTVLVGTAGSARNVRPAEQSIQFAKVQLNVSENDVYLNGIHVSSDSAAADTKIQNVRIFDGATEIGSGAPSLIYNGSYYYAWVNIKPPLYISAGMSKSFTVVADITASAGNGPVRVGVAGLNFDSPGAAVLNLPAYENTMNVVRP